MVNKAFDDWRDWTQAQMVADPCADTNHLSNAEERPLSEPPIEGWLKCDIGIHWCRNSLISHDFNMF